MKLLSIIAVLFAFNANAGITIYDAEGNEKNSNYLVKQGGWVPEAGELTKEDLKKMNKADFVKYINQIPDENKPIEKQKVRNLGTVIYFVDLDNVNRTTSDVMNSIEEIEGVRKVYYLKQPKAVSALILLATKTDGKLDVDLKIDSGNKVARRLHVDDYPQMMYLMPDGTKSRYSGKKGGLMALKLRIGEVKALLELEEQAKRDKLVY
tara:strand:- start:1197 stop:1820 length:624 start_codon:yes stop_codon:yes gene_type:complete